MANATYTDLKDVESQKENMAVVSLQAKTSASSVLFSVLGSLNNCTIGSLTVNMNPSVTVHSEAEDIQEELDAIVSKLVDSLLPYCCLHSHSIHFLHGVIAFPIHLPRYCV